MGALALAMSFLSLPSTSEPEPIISAVRTPSESMVKVVRNGVDAEGVGECVIGVAVVDPGRGCKPFCVNDLF